jgi:hypothetical protein
MVTLLDEQIAKLLGDTAAVSALHDRLLHHAHVLLQPLRDRGKE